MSSRRIKALGGVGILTEADIEGLDAGCFRVLKLMSDCGWHAPHEIRSAAGGDRVASEGLRRLRELRPVLAQIGWKVEKARSQWDRRTWCYRIVPDEDARPRNGELFP